MKHHKLITIGLSLAASAALTAQEKPNVVFILTDDLGYGDLSSYGQEKFQTPNIDRLALQGTRFTRSYSGTTVSAPSRASLLTGLHTGHTPIRGNMEIQPEGQFPLPEGTYTLFHLFKDAGYTTGAFGKWGLGFPGSSGDPVNQGVDHFFGYNCQRMAHNYYPPYLWENDTKVLFPENDGGKRGTYAQDLIHRKALEFIDEQKGNPFFLYVPILLPHAELIVPEDSIIQQFRGQFEETPYQGADDRTAFTQGGYRSQEHPRATHAAMVTRVDHLVGEIIEKLESEGLMENTLIIFTSDNGPHREGGADPDFFNSNGMYRGYKRDLYEGGIRVPTIAVWEGSIPAGRENGFAFAFWDYMATFAELVEEELTTGTDGVSILSTLLEQGEQEERDYLYFEFLEMGGRQAVMQGDWKLLHLDIRNGGRYELYNIASDPSENHDIKHLFPRKTEELKKIMQEARVDDANWQLF